MPCSSKPATRPAWDVVPVVDGGGYERSYSRLEPEALPLSQMQERCTHDSVVPGLHSRSEQHWYAWLIWMKLRKTNRWRWFACPTSSRGGGSAPIRAHTYSVNVPRSESVFGPGVGWRTQSSCAATPDPFPHPFKKLAEKDEGSPWRCATALEGELGEWPSGSWIGRSTWIADRTAREVPTLRKASQPSAADTRANR